MVNILIICGNREFMHTANVFQMAMAQNYGTFLTHIRMVIFSWKPSIWSINHFEPYPNQVEYDVPRSILIWNLCFPYASHSRLNIFIKCHSLPFFKHSRIVVVFVWIEPNLFMSFRQVHVHRLGYQTFRVLYQM